VADAAREAETLRAAAEVFVPGLLEDTTPGAADIAAERFLSHYLDLLLPGLASGVPALLDQLATSMFEEERFSDLELDARAKVLDALTEHEIEQLRELPTLLGVLTIGAVYGEWTGTNDGGDVVRAPLGWRLTGFEGPVRARPKLLP
jgi:hypothetical protein